MNFWHKAKAFIVKDFIIETSYKVSFVIQMFGSILPLVSFFFVGKLMEEGTTETLAKYGGDYFPFALIGIAFTRYFQLAVTTFSDSMRRAQMAGCLEAILSSQTNPKTIVLNSALYSFISAAVQLILMFVVGSLFLGFSFSGINIGATLVTFILSILAFVSFGMFAAAGTIIFKKGEPFGFVFSHLSAILGGAYFPVTLMPGWLEAVSYVFPIYYALDALRLAILQGYTLNMISQDLFIISGMTLVFFPLSLYFFEWAVEKGKQEGTLIQY